MTDLPMVSLRRTYYPTYTAGRIDFFGNSLATTELPNLDNRPMVSCVPEGTYSCLWAEMHDHPGHWHYELQSVAGRSGIFIHYGRTVADTKGCILLDPQSCSTFETIMDKQPFMLVIC